MISIEKGQLIFIQIGFSNYSNILVVIASLSVSLTGFSPVNVYWTLLNIVQASL